MRQLEFQERNQEEHQQGRTQGNNTGGKNDLNYLQRIILTAVGIFHKWFLFLICIFVINELLNDLFISGCRKSPQHLQLEQGID